MKKKAKDILLKIGSWLEKHTFISGVMASIVASAICGILAYIFALKPVQELGNQFNILNENINSAYASIQTQIDNTQTDISNYNQNITNLKSEFNTQINNIQSEFNSQISSIQNELNSQNTNINIYNGYAISDTLYNALYGTFNTDKDVFSSSEKCQFNDQATKLLINNTTGDTYTVNDLIETDIVLHYTDNGDDIFFKGKYDQNGYWDGNCIINRYRDGKLILIMDAQYDSGTLISYKQAFSYEKIYQGSKYGVWAIAERRPENGSDSGFTWTYYKQDEYTQSFESDLVTNKDVLSIENFRERITLLCEGYYNGYTSDGHYNDTTGNAYLVKFNEYGYVRFLYVGHIVDGYPNDDTGKAWSISWGYNNKDYYYYKGKFKDGDHIEGTPEKISLEDIKSLIDINDFGCELNWIEKQ